MPNNLKRLVSARKAAEFYCIGHSTLWRWVKEGRVPAPIRIGRRTFWEEQTLLEHVASLRTQHNAIVSPSGATNHGH